MRTDWTAEEIKDIINRNDRQLCLAIVQIYNCQTEDEKLNKETSHDNGIGFNAFDSEILSSFAEQYLERGSLTKRQLEVARKKMQKYSKQLANLANEQALRKLHEYDLKNFIVTFDSINVGECFECDDHIYLRMEDIYYSDETVYNAVDLEYGIVEDFYCDATVTRLKNAKITLI